MRYLLDSDICIFLLRGHKGIAERIDRIGFSNCAISEITKAELLTGMHYAKMKNRLFQEDRLRGFVEAITVIPISQGIEKYAEEKARLIHEGRPVGDFDLLKGCSAVACSMVMVTNNVSHFERIGSIVIENWKEISVPDRLLPDLRKE